MVTRAVQAHTSQRLSTESSIRSDSIVLRLIQAGNMPQQR